MYNGKAIRGPQPKQGLKTYLDYKKKQLMKELNEELGDRIFNEQQKFLIKPLILLQESPLS